MANEIAITIKDLDRFSGVEGFHFRRDIRGKLSDVTLPKDYHLISKTVQSGLLKKIEFFDNAQRRFVCE